MPTLLYNLELTDAELRYLELLLMARLELDSAAAPIQEKIWRLMEGR